MVAYTLNKGVEPPLSHELLWRQAAETPQLCDHVGLIAVTHLDGDIGPRHKAAVVGVAQRCMKSSQTAKQLGCDAHGLAEGTGEMLARNACLVRHALDAHLAAMA